MRRRDLLQTLGLGTAALPFASVLRSIGEAQDGSPPLRVVLLFSAYGGRWDYFRPRVPGLSYANDDASGPPLAGDFPLTPESLTFQDSVLAPLSAFASRMTVVEGLALTAGLIPGSHLVGHENAPATAFTGTTPTADYDATGPSLEHYLGEQLGAETAQRSLQLGVGSTASTTVYDSVNYNRSGTRVPVLTNPQDAFRLLFGGLSGGGEPEVDEAAERSRRRDRRVADALFASTQRMRSRLAGAEREKLDQHLSALRDIEARLEDGPGAGPIPIACGQPSAPTSTPSTSGAEVADHTEVMFDVLAQALACDRTRYASAVWGVSNNSFAPWMLSDVDDWHNQVAHVVDADGASADLANRQMAELNRWYASQLATLAQRLDAVPEGEGTVLDNTVIVWAQDFGQTAHSGVNVPYVLLGGGAGRLRMGRYLNVYEPVEHDIFGYAYSSGDPDSYRPSNELFTAILRACGIDASGFGDISGVLDSLLV